MYRHAPLSSPDAHVNILVQLFGKLYNEFHENYIVFSLTAAYLIF